MASDLLAHPLCLFLSDMEIPKMPGVDWVQEHVMKQGPQDNESAIEQAKDEQISGRLSCSAGC